MTSQTTNTLSCGSRSTRGASYVQPWLDARARSGDSTRSPPSQAVLRYVDGDERGRDVACAAVLSGLVGEAAMDRDRGVHRQVGRVLQSQVSGVFGLGDPSLECVAAVGCCELGYTADKHTKRDASGYARAQDANCVHTATRAAAE